MGFFPSDLEFILAAEFSDAIDFYNQTFTPPIIGSSTGIFDKTYEEIDPETGAIVMSRNPRIFVAIDKIEIDFGQEIKELGVVIILSEDYVIKSIQRDGVGGAYLFLKRFVRIPILPP